VVGVVTSISSQKDVRAVPVRWVPHDASLTAYQELLQGTRSQRSGGTVTEAGVFSHAMLTSAQVAVLATAATLLVSIKRQPGISAAELAAQRDAVRVALSTLPAKDREVIALKYHADLSNAEIAEIIGVSPTNAGTLLHRAMTKLREAVDA